MPQPNVLNPRPPEFERFLYASVGEDRNGYVVTVLSTLARLGLDPWTETAGLVALKREVARSRLAELLAGFRDVPALVTDHRMVARELSLLLPESPPHSPRQPASTVAVGRLGSGGGIWAILAVAFVLVQILFSAAPGSGE